MEIFPGDLTMRVHRSVELIKTKLPIQCGVLSLLLFLERPRSRRSNGPDRGAGPTMKRKKVVLCRRILCLKVPGTGGIPALIRWMMGVVGIVISFLIVASAIAQERATDPRTRFRVPYTSNPPSIEGRIDGDTWKRAVRIRGGVRTAVPGFSDGQIHRWLPHDPGKIFSHRSTFYVMWNEEALYVAARSEIREGERLWQMHREGRPRPPVIHDDTFEFAFDATRLASSGTVPDRPIIAMLNRSGLSRLLQVEPDFRPYDRIYSAPDRMKPEKVSSHVWMDDEGRRFWDVQLSYPRKALKRSRPFRSGDEIGLGLGRYTQFPWGYEMLPMEGRYMNREELPAGRLVKNKPYVQIRRMTGFNQGRIRGTIRLINPDRKKHVLAVRVTAVDAEGNRDERVATTRNVPGESSQSVSLENPLVPSDTAVELEVEGTSKEKRTTVFSTRWELDQKKNDRPGFLDFTPPRDDLPVDFRSFNRSSERLILSVDPDSTSLDDRGSVQKMECRIRTESEDRSVALKRTAAVPEEGPVKTELTLANLSAGSYGIQIALVGASGNALLERSLKGFEKHIVRGKQPVYQWWQEVETDRTALRDHPVLRNLDPVTERINRWYQEGEVSGNVEDYYHNHDGLHSYLALSKFPQVTPTDTTEASYSLRGTGLQDRKLFTGRVLGNASMVAGHALPEHAYRSPRRVEALYRQYVNNHHYVYVSHTTGPEEFSAYTPYVVTAKGASGSDQPFLEALFATLASFPPDTKKRLTDEGLIAPTLQYLLRRHYGDAGRPEEYVTPRSHPVIFKGQHIGLSDMVDAARSMRPDEIPPVVRLRVLEEDFQRSEPREIRFTTPGAIARAFGEKGGTRTIHVRAADSDGVNNPVVHWKWVLLRGDRKRVNMNTLNEDGSEARITVENPSGRVDIGVFGHNRVRWSAPAVISVNDQIPD